jgi:hypothetical protein
MRPPRAALPREPLRDFARVAKALAYELTSLQRELESVAHAARNWSVGSNIGTFLQDPIGHLETVYEDAWPIESGVEAERMAEATLALGGSSRTRRSTSAPLAEARLTWCR